MLHKPDHCKSCVGWGWSCPTIGEGFVAPSGSGKNGVLIVGEAAGEEESLKGVPFIGKAGFTLSKLMKRADLERDDFRICNVLSCRPPNNKLLGMPYAQEAIDHCAKYLDDVIEEFKPKCILTLGNFAFRRVLPEVANQKGVGLLESKKHKGAVGYVFRSQKYDTWSLATIHPSFILRGQTAWAQVLIYTLQRSVEIAREGYAYDIPDYTLDCTPAEALRWVEQFEAYYSQNPDLYLSCDIETPEKGANEEDLDLEDGSDYTILRCGYSYRDLHGLSIPWGGPYQMVHERLLRSQCQKVWWNGGYDIPRILSQGVTIDGASHDGMDAWHVLNSDLKKSLGFVTPFFRKRQRMWKHESSEKPAYYNCVDADVAGGNMRGTVELLKKHGMFGVYNEFICELDPVFSAMSRAGMPVDVSRRTESSKALIERRRIVRETLQTLVPDAIKPFSPKNGYVRTPANTEGLQQIVLNGVRKTVCSVCGIDAPKKSHFKERTAKVCPTCGGKWLKRHIKTCSATEPVVRSINPCVGGSATERLEGETRWAKVLPFIPSTKGIMRYQEWNKHPLVFTGRGDDRKATTDEKAIKKLIGKYPDHKFYQLCLEDRELTKLLGTYIGYYEET